jgi:hypothetical protein
MPAELESYRVGAELVTNWCQIGAKSAEFVSKWWCELVELATFCRSKPKASFLSICFHAQHWLVCYSKCFGSGVIRENVMGKKWRRNWMSCNECPPPPSRTHMSVNRMHYVLDERQGAKSSQTSNTQYIPGCHGTPTPSHIESAKIPILFMTDSLRRCLSPCNWLFVPLELVDTIVLERRLCARMFTLIQQANMFNELHLIYLDSICSRCVNRRKRHLNYFLHDFQKVCWVNKCFLLNTPHTSHRGQCCSFLMLKRILLATSEKFHTTIIDLVPTMLNIWNFEFDFPNLSQHVVALRPTK